MAAVKARDPLFGAVTWLLACLSVLPARLGAGPLAAGWHLPAFTSAVVEACLTSADWPHDHVHATLRSRHVEAVRLVGQADADLGAGIVDAPEPAVYCMADARPTIVATTCALRALSPAALAAVLSHERCHLIERHHLLIRACQLLARAFPFVPLFREARSRMGGLLELRADDVAARRLDEIRRIEWVDVLGGAHARSG